jgi:hypothetical protein
MKKNLSILLFVIVSLFYSTLKSQTFAISAYSTGLCVNSKAYASVTTTMAGATTYSWLAVTGNTCSPTLTMSSNNMSAYIHYPCCGTYTIICWAYNGSTQLGTATSQVSVSCNSASTLTISSTASNGTFCSTSNVTLSANGNTTYTWLPGNTNNPTVLITPTTSGCYTVVANNSLGCFNMSPSYCASVIPTYSIGVAGNTAVCLGNSASLSLTGGPSFFTLPGSITSSSPVLTPSVTTTYTIWCPTPTYACPVFTTETIIVNPSPNITISNSLFSSCAGTSNTLIASGAASYTWSNLTYSNSTVVNPTISTCYSVVGQSSLMCWNMATICLNVLPLPTLIVSGSNTVCLGSSTTLTVSGASTYTWGTSTWTLGSGISITPSTSTCYTVIGTNSTGCNGMAVNCVSVDTTCSNVWPGDANSDGVVNTSDVFEIGLAFSNTGAARSPGGNAYTSQFANNWTGTVSTGKNKCHADCNGDGTVNNSDTLAIFNNFLLTHSFKLSEIAVNGDISFSSNSTYVNEGMWSKVDILLGSSASPVNQVYGVAFDVNFDQSLIEVNSAYLVYSSSFLNASNQNVQFRKADFTNGKIYAASVRIDGANVSGSGKIGEFWFKAKTGLPANSILNISASNASRINNSNATSVLSGGSTSLTLVKDAVGVAENNLEYSIQLFPNPASNVITLQSAVNSKVSYIIFDIVGREVSNGEFTHSKTIDLSDYANGSYLVRLESEGTFIFKKLVVEK